MVHSRSRLSGASLHPRLYEQLRAGLGAVPECLMLLDAPFELRGEVVCLLNS